MSFTQQLENVMSLLNQLRSLEVVDEFQSLLSYKIHGLEHTLQTALGSYKIAVDSVKRDFLQQQLQLISNPPTLAEKNTPTSPTKEKVVLPNQSRIAQDNPPLSSSNSCIPNSSDPNVFNNTVPIQDNVHLAHEVHVVHEDNDDQWKQVQKNRKFTSNKKRGSYGKLTCEMDGYNSDSVCQLENYYEYGLEYADPRQLAERNRFSVLSNDIEDFKLIVKQFDVTI